jgi:hypothetical protein
MGYQLAALIGARKALAGLAATLPGARVVDLRAELALLPLTTQVRAHLAATAGDPPEAQPVRGVAGFTADLASPGRGVVRDRTAPLCRVRDLGRAPDGRPRSPGVTDRVLGVQS